MARTKKTTTSKSSSTSKKSNSINKNSSVTAKEVKTAKSEVAKQLTPTPVSIKNLQADVVMNSLTTYDPTPKATVKSVLGTTRPIFYPFKAYLGDGMIYINLSRVHKVCRYTANQEASQIYTDQSTHIVMGSVAEVMSIIGANV